MQVIKNKEVINDDWQLIRDIDTDTAIPDGQVILPFEYWQANREGLLKRDTEHAVLINGDTVTEDLLDDLEHFSVIALDFPAFGDGRSYSHASLLRQRYDYKGDLRAVGDVLQDQLFFMQRCGFDSYAIREDKDIEEALKSLNDFTIRYQTAADGALPIYKQR
jgi:uncharacterized protein (DUF934 family)